MKKGILQTVLAYPLVSVFLISVSATAHAGTTKIEGIKAIKNSTLVLRVEKSAITPRKTMGGAYSSNRLKGSSRKKFTQRNISKVRLKSSFPRKLGIANYDVLWKVKDLKKRSVRQHRGKIANIKLSPGRYQITMQIGKFKQKKIISVRKSRNTVQSFSIPVKAGLLKVAANSRSNGPGGAKIYVKDSRGKIVASSKGTPITQLLRSGKYTIEVAYNNKSRGRNVIHIRNGLVKKANVKLPSSGKVRLRAYVNGKQPLMSSSSWIIYDKKGKTVYRTKKHTVRKSFPPGSYTAKLTAAGKTKSKKFKVSSGQNKTVVLHL